MINVLKLYNKTKTLVTQMKNTNLEKEPKWIGNTDLYKSSEYKKPFFLWL